MEQVITQEAIVRAFGRLDAAFVPGDLREALDRLFADEFAMAQLSRLMTEEAHA